MPAMRQVVRAASGGSRSARRTGAGVWDEGGDCLGAVRGMRWEGDAVKMVEGHEVWHITSRRCKRTVERIPKSPNDLVGKQDKMRCGKCGGRGADLLRVWTVGPRPKAPSQ